MLEQPRLPDRNGSRRPCRVRISLHAHRGTCLCDARSKSLANVRLELSPPPQLSEFQGLYVKQFLETSREVTAVLIARFRGNDFDRHTCHSQLVCGATKTPIPRVFFDSDSD